MKNKSLSEFDWNSNCIAVDVDGTLVTWYGDNPGIPSDKGYMANGELIEKLFYWKKNKANPFLIVWSGNGVEHAKMMVHILALNGLVDAVIPKPTAVIDDTLDWFDEQSVIINPNK